MPYACSRSCSLMYLPPWPIQTSTHISRTLLLRSPYTWIALHAFSHMWLLGLFHCLVLKKWFACLADSVPHFGWRVHVMMRLCCCVSGQSWDISNNVAMLKVKITHLYVLQQQCWVVPRAHHLRCSWAISTKVVSSSARQNMCTGWLVTPSSSTGASQCKKASTCGSAYAGACMWSAL